MQYDTRHFAPIGILRRCIEQTQIGHKVFFVIARENRGFGCLVRDFGIKRRFYRSLSSSAPLCQRSLSGKLWREPWPESIRKAERLPTVKLARCVFHALGLRIVP